MSPRNEPADNWRRETAAHSYSIVSSTYDLMNHVFTGGQNLAARLSQLRDIKPGDRVLYVGAGTSEDALAASRQGARVTCIDLSPAMIQRGRRRFDEAGLKADFVCMDIMEYTPTELFDVVVANFFLNIFTRPVMEKVLRHVVSYVRPQGKFLIADFAIPSGNLLLRTMQCVIVYGACFCHWVVGLVGMHWIYNYSRYYSELGLQEVGRSRFRIFWKGPWLFESVTAIKIS